MSDPESNVRGGRRTAPKKSKARRREADAEPEEDFIQKAIQASLKASKEEEQRRKAQSEREERKLNEQIEEIKYLSRATASKDWNRADERLRRENSAEGAAVDAEEEKLKKALEESLHDQTSEEDEEIRRAIAESARESAREDAERKARDAAELARLDANFGSGNTGGLNGRRRGQEAASIAIIPSMPAEHSRSRRYEPKATTETTCRSRTSTNREA